MINAANLASSRGGGLNGDGLFILADKTGGVVVEGGNDLAQGLGQALRRSAHSYLLTVQVDVPSDGAYHPLEVRLRKPERGTRLVHRGGYFAPKPATATRQRKSAEHLADAARLASEGGERNDLGVRALAVPLPTTGDPVRTAVLVEVPGDRLLDLAADTARLDLEVFGYVLDDRGEPQDFFAQAVQLDPAKVGDRLRQGGVRVLGKLDADRPSPDRHPAARRLLPGASPRQGQRDRPSDGGAFVSDRVKEDEVSAAPFPEEPPPTCGGPANP